MTRTSLHGIGRLLAITTLILLPIAVLARQRGPTPAGVVFTPPAPPASLAPLPSGPGTLSGRAIEQGTNAPIPGATVVIRQLGGRPEAVASPNARVVLAGKVLTCDAEGRFTLAGIPLGDYGVNVSAEGFSGVGGPLPGSGKTMRITAEQPSASGEFVFSRLGSVSGVVLNEDGRPAGDVVVRLLERMATLTGLPMRPIPFTALTDASGGYRFTSVPPGDYAVCVYSRSITMPDSVLEMYRLAIQEHRENSVLTQLQDSEAPVPRPLPPGLGFKAGNVELSMDDALQRLRPIQVGTGGRIVGIPTTYHPSTVSLDEARRLTIAANTNLTDVNIRLAQVPTFHVSGKLAGAAEKIAYMGLRLMPVGSEHFYRTLAVEAAITVTEADGRFTFAGVAPGRYTLEGFSAPYPAGEYRAGSTIPVGPDGIMLRRELQVWVKSEITVAQADLRDLAVPLKPALVVRGKLEYVDESGNPVSERPASGAVRLTLTPATGPRVGGGMTTDVQGDVFKLGPVFPSKCTLRAMATGPWRVSSIKATGRTIGNDPIEIADSDLTGVVVTVVRSR